MRHVVRRHLLGCAGGQGAREGGIAVADIDMQERRLRREARLGRPHHHHAVTDPDGDELEYSFDAAEEQRIPTLLKKLGELGIGYKDLNTQQSSLEDIFVSLVTTRHPRGSGGPASLDSRLRGNDKT